MNPLNSTHPSRRDVLVAGGAAALTALNAFPARAASPNDKLNIAGIGVGGKGYHDIRSVGSENIVAICDVDRNMLERAGKQFPSARKYRDYRELLAKEKDLDAVMIATPDHAHAVVTIAALKAGLHVFCQKPLTRTVGEALQVLEAAETAGTATQMGNQAQAGEGARLVREYIASGVLGTIQEIHAWSNRPNPISPRGIARPSDTPPVPGHLDWNLWLGPAPERPYHPHYHPFRWRGWWDFGSGVLGDIGCHQLSAVFKALNLGWPESVEASSTHWHASEDIRRETAPNASIITYRFAATSQHGPIILRWYDGGMTPPYPLGVDVEREIFKNDGTLIIGTDGMLHNHRLLPESRMQRFGKPGRLLARSPGHYKEWLRACKGGPKAGSDFVKHAAHLTAVVQLGNLAIRTRKKLLWDADALQFTNSDEANKLIHQPTRDGWSLG